MYTTSNLFPILVFEPAGWLNRSLWPHMEKFKCLCM